MINSVDNSIGVKCACLGGKCGLLADDPRHGSMNGYGNLSCRCDPCRGANSIYLGEARIRRIARGIPEHVHGTAGGYGNYGCRCAPCTNAHNEDVIGRRRRQRSGDTRVARGLMAAPKRRVIGPLRPSAKEPRPPEERFWEKVKKTDTCWLWMAGKTPKGYGVFYGGPQHPRKAAHRYAYELMVGPIPSGMELDHRHTCPKNCVRPEHLRAVTHKQNCENHRNIRASNTSGARGVTRSKGRRRWEAAFSHNGEFIHVGMYDTVQEAAEAVSARRREVFTHSDMDLEPIAVGEVMGDEERREAS